MKNLENIWKNQSPLELKKSICFSMDKNSVYTTDSVQNKMLKSTFGYDSVQLCLSSGIWFSSRCFSPPGRIIFFSTLTSMQHLCSGCVILHIPSRWRYYSLREYQLSLLVSFPPRWIYSANWNAETPEPQMFSRRTDLTKVKSINWIHNELELKR